MTREEKQLLLKDLCGRLPYGVKFQNENIPTPNVATLDMTYLRMFEINEGLIFKPYLRPISSITDEEWKKFEHLVFGIGPYHNEKLLRYSMKVVDNAGEEQLLFVRGGVDADWFNEHHFDYRGLIEKGLALEAPEGMYKAV